MWKLLRNPPPGYLMVVVVVVVLYWVNLAKPEQCFSEFASPYGSGLGWGTGKMCTRFGACKGSGSHVYTRKVNVKSGDAGAQRLVLHLLAHRVSMTKQLGLQQFLLDPAASPAPEQSTCSLHDGRRQLSLQVTTIVRVEVGMCRLSLVLLGSRVSLFHLTSCLYWSGFHQGDQTCRRCI